MKPHEFFHFYANTPLSERMVPLNVAKYGLTTLDDIFKEVRRLEDIMRPHAIEEDRLLRIAAEHFAKGRCAEDMMPDEKKGRWTCLREKGHEGPCAAVPTF